MYYNGAAPCGPPCEPEAPCAVQTSCDTEIVLPTETTCTPETTTCTPETTPCALETTPRTTETTLCATESTTCSPETTPCTTETPTTVQTTPCSSETTPCVVQTTPCDWDLKFERVMDGERTALELLNVCDKDIFPHLHTLLRVFIT
nr:unnamed protein product [Callosobruchus chinensis]